MKSKIKERFIWFTGISGALLVCFLICRYFSSVLYKNTQWAGILFVFGLAVIFIAAILCAKKIMISSTAGYAVGFLTGFIFNYEYDFIIDGVIQDSRNTWWQIWTVVFLVMIIAGIVWEIVNVIIKRYKK